MYDLQTLLPVPVFEGLSERDLRVLSEIAGIQHTARGEKLITRGEPASAFYVIHDGRFALTAELQALHKSVETTIEVKTERDAFGWSAVLRPRPSIYSVYCVWPGSVIRFEREELNALMLADAGLGFRLTRNVGGIIGDRATVLEDLWREEVSQRIERVRHWMGRQIKF